MNTPEAPRRKNGLSAPYSWAQIAAWAAFFLSLLEFLVFVAPILPVAGSVVLTLVFVGLWTATFYNGILTQSIDPIDLHLHQHLQSRGDAGSPTKASGLFRHFCQQEVPPAPSSDALKQCWICDTQVQETSMHCKYCSKCVYKFDHHCMWLNTCIGATNYPYFYRTMWFIFAMEVTHFFVQMGLFVDYFQDGATVDRAKDAYGSGAFVIAIVIFFFCFNMVSIFMIGQLLWFHLNLHKEGLTTYAYIVRDHARRRERTRSLEVLSAKRVVALSKAREEGKRMEVLRLRLGGWGRKVGWDFLDPMELPAPNPEDFGDALGSAENGSPRSRSSGSPKSGRSESRSRSDSRSRASSGRHSSPSRTSPRTSPKRSKSSSTGSSAVRLKV